jgi:hypothetical protein
VNSDTSIVASGRVLGRRPLELADPAHDVDSGWRELEATAAEARGRSLEECLDHMAEVEALAERAGLESLLLELRSTAALIRDYRDRIVDDVRALRLRGGRT